MLDAVFLGAHHRPRVPDPARGDHARAASSACRSSSSAAAGDGASSRAFLVALTCLVVILPWWVRNLTTFEDPVFLATGHGSVLQIANCDDTYHGALLGYWDINCLTADRPPATAEQRKLQRSTKVPGLVYLIAQDPRDESIPDATARDKALHYIKDHLYACPDRGAGAGRPCVGRLPRQPRGEPRHLLRTARQVAVVGGDVDVLRPGRVRRCTRSW